jgi:hypothetical protein
MKDEGTGDDHVPLSSWLKSTRRYLENTTADDTQVSMWSVMELPEAHVYTVAEGRRDLAAKDAILSHLSPAMLAGVEKLAHAADMWRSLQKVSVTSLNPPVHFRGGNGSVDSPGLPKNDRPHCDKFRLASLGGEPSLCGTA